MRALVSAATGGPESLVLRELPDPVAGPGQLLVRVKACGLNFPDALVIEDKYQIRPPRPFAPGSEIAGVVEAVGEDVTGWAPGDALASVTLHGGLAEKIAVPVDEAFRLQAGQSFEQAAALLLTYGTAIHALVDRGQAKAGETLLVLGAAGGVGIASIQVGKALGLRVIAAVSSDEKAAEARAAGADDALVYGAAPFDRDQSRALADRFKAAVGGEGADIVVDPVGGDYAEPAFRAMGWNGRYLVLGFTAGIPKLPLNLPLLKSADVRGVAWGAWAVRDPEGNRANAARLFAWLEQGLIAPRIAETLPFERAAEGIARLKGRGAIGKLVVSLG
ncbi:NADPH:quinone oxidoreductase family protein [Rhizorhabdus dicambivorans]|uniref:NADPH:quinone oxidoreductase n=1 Tax=Rhizorhabdus dicambivorans TaxID=1850238 RepID=A0A2A4FW38_9SPHN|nr:NADPH:quinone oxidoreductase family protein [Rhizorhabdus dicambivorans]ATE65887.1 NADPH:quinone oxidoreductase [Rhizorhabdus dicambivorans]PCE43001.1 NADPH:quinone oxidoreductase [Rhizorhabdus dicambivorans]